MGVSESMEDTVEIAVENIGGIDETRVAFSGGVTVLTGRNATNRTSLLQAVMAGLGSDNVSLKGDADEGHVELTVGGETYTRTLRRGNGTVQTSGDPYLDDPTLADLFVFLLESNEARRAVELGGDLREIIMRPVDTDAIEAEIDELQAERDAVEDRLEELRSLQRQLPDLEQRKGELEAEIEETETELAEVREAIEAADQEVSATREQEAELEEALGSFREARSELEDVRYNVESERESIAALDDETAELENELAELPEAPMSEVDDVERRIEELRERREALDGTVTDLQKVIQFNEEMLEGTSSEVAAALRDDDAAVTDRLVDDQVVCWTCGSEVDSESIESTLERMRELRQGKLAERRDVQSEIDECKTEKATYEEQRRQRSQIERRLDAATEERDRRQERLADLEDERDRLKERIADLEAEVDRLRDETQSELLDLHTEANELEFELERLRSELSEVESERERIESELDERGELSDRRSAIADEIADLRTRIDRIEAEAIEQFNEHMESVLAILDYENLERVWIERKQQTVPDGRGTTEETVFDLHVVRSTADGTTYEDSVDHLSESEREVTGLVFALAGYLTHDIHEVCPFLLLDSVEAIDSDRIASLVDYMADFPDHVIVALLPEDAQALDDNYRRVTDI
ncbi:MAG: archaea-specific SMC-related protein [Haloarculaceae archaeon]